MGNKKVELKNSNLLIITYPFPPIPYSGTYRILRISKGLSKLGVEVHALSIKIDDDIPNDYDLISKTPRSVTIHRTPIIDPWLKYQTWKNRNRAKKGSNFINKIVSLLLRLITIPDHQILWIPFAVSHGLKIIKKHNIKTILITSPPNSSLLIGYFLKRLTKVKFMADLRDPIVGNIAQVNLINPTDLLSKVEKNVLMRLEKVIVNSADIIVTNTETHRKEMKAKYNLDKFHTVRNAFDDDDYKGISQEKYPKFTISHIGSMYGLRKADVLFEAIKRLEARFDLEPLNLQVLFIGATDGRLEQAISEYGIENYVKVQPSVSHRKAIEIMTRSHLLLLVKATGEGSYGQIPAKFYEYLGTGNSILCIGPEMSEVASIIYDLNIGYVIEDDIQNMYEILEREYDQFQQKQTISIVPTQISAFSTSNMAKAIKSFL